MTVSTYFAGASDNLIEKISFVTYYLKNYNVFSEMYEKFRLKNGDNIERRQTG
jgi:hypothetical protein